MTDTHAPAKTRRPRSKIPLAVHAMRLGFKTLGRVLPSTAAGFAYRTWFLTRRFPVPAREQAWLQTARSEIVQTPEGPIATYQWGEQGPFVYLVHGWNGRGSQLAAFAAPLVAKGYRVVAFDGPGHGNTPGPNHATLPRFARVLQSLTQQLGPAEAMIAHSFGSAVVTYALSHHLLTTQRVVSLSPVSRMRFLTEYFFQGLHIPPGVQRRFHHRVEKEFGVDIWTRISPDHNVPGLGHVPALLLHCQDDQDIPAHEGARLHNLWPNSRFVQTEGLGHRRILRDPEVVRQVVEFVTEHH